MRNEFIDRTLNFGQLDIAQSIMVIERCLSSCFPGRVEMSQDNPNPTLGILMVEIPSGFESIKAQLTDATGRVVFEQEEVSGLATLNLRHLASGIYTLHLQSENGELQESHKIQISK